MKRKNSENFTEVCTVSLRNSDIKILLFNFFKSREQVRCRSVVDHLLWCD